MITGVEIIHEDRVQSLHLMFLLNLKSTQQQQEEKEEEKRDVIEELSSSGKGKISRKGLVQFDVQQEKNDLVY